MFGSEKNLSIYPEPEFANLLRNLGIDLAGGTTTLLEVHRPAMLHRLAELIPGLLKRLQIRAQIIAVKKRNMFVAAHAFSAVVLSPPPLPSESPKER